MNRPTEGQRLDLAHRLAEVITREYKGVKQDAYRAADLNSQTLDNALAGLPIAPRSLVKIMLAFWPATDGDWMKMTPALREASDALPDVSGLSNDQATRLLEGMRQELVDRGVVTPDRYLELLDAAIRWHESLALAANDSADDPLQQEPGAEEGPST